MMTTLLAKRPADARPSEQDKAPLPRQLVLDWTDYCNAKCFFCFRDKYEKAIGGKGEFIPFAKLKKLENVLSEVKIFGISSGIGEPLLHPELEEILTWLYQINPSILLQTVTNGTTLTAAKAPWFAGHLDWLSVSLNAANGEAHMRDMFPHLADRGIDAEKRWELHVRHLTEFVAALPPEDRPRVRFQMVVHRYNVKDISDFVRLVHKMGGSQVVLTNISAHPDTIDWSLYWIKDEYNAAIEEACELGTRLGVQVHAVRFFTGVKPVLDLDKVCRDPVDIAYISRSASASPCCNWTEHQIPVDYYDTDDGFEQYWNSDLLRRLRRKRDLPSCRICGMSRVFDETSFHFSPLLKKELIAAGRLSQINSENDYPDAQLVRRCVEDRLDLPSIRRTLLALNLPVELAGKIESQGLAALSALEKTCWKAFETADVPVQNGDIALAAPFLGIGWGPPIHEPQNRVSARSLSAAQAATLFVRVTPRPNHELRFLIHSAPAELHAQLRLEVNGRELDTRVVADQIGRMVVSATLPEDLANAHDGRLWVRVGYFASRTKPSPQLAVSFMQFGLSEIGRAVALDPEQVIAAKNGLIGQQQARIAELEGLLKAMYASRSWRVTAPLRKFRVWLRH
jgi:MoaA/NifB/PqqE/SkfB family radical SAM enzyme